MTKETKSDAVASVEQMAEAPEGVEPARALTETELATVTGGVKPWLDPNREPDTAIFYTVESRM